MPDFDSSGLAGHKGARSPAGSAEFAMPKDIHPSLTDHEAAVEAARCHFCFDAPCIEACPTGIDIPQFIRQISTGNLLGSARTIMDENIFGAMCARVCPTEILCEEACVRNKGEHRPVEIGALQRHATDALLATGSHPYSRAATNGKNVAVVGAGPAGLSCAHRLARLGHSVTVFESNSKPGGLNEYGIAPYKVPDRIAQREIDFILKIGGIDIRTGQSLGKDFTLADLRRDFDAVFLGIGLSDVNKLGIPSEDQSIVQDAVRYIALVRQSRELSDLAVGRRVVVIGGGMTAIDIGCQSKWLGGEEVTIVYRRGPEHMGASQKEQDFARANGVIIRCWARPTSIDAEGSSARMTFERTAIGDDGSLVGTGETFAIEADSVFRAVGQRLNQSPLDSGDQMLALVGGRISIDESGRTSLDGVWAGGDCTDAGEDLTVHAVQQGKVAAHAIDEYLRDQRSEISNG